MVDFNSEGIICQKFHGFKRKIKLTATAKLAALNIIVQFICYFHKDKLFSKDKTK